jgi:hypothetical protein
MKWAFQRAAKVTLPSTFGFGQMRASQRSRLAALWVRPVGLGTRYPNGHGWFDLNG